MNRVFNREKSNVIMKMYWYWIIIIVWQFVRPVGNRSIIDTLVKMFMFGMILLFAVNNGAGLKVYGKTGKAIIIFLVTQVVTVIFDSGNLSMGNIITIIFMFIELIVFLGMLNFQTISVEELERFCVSVIITVLIMCLYNMLFNSSRFLNTFTAGDAYGHECKSFLYSNHEFGIYLSTGIISSVWLYTRKKIKNLPFWSCIGIMIINLFSTYSRTAILGCIAACFVLIFFYNKTNFAFLTTGFIVLLAGIISNEKLKSIVFDKIMKGSFDNGQVLDEGRSSMYLEEFHNFLDGTLGQKIFGYGYAGKEMFGGHDAYLTILLTGGIVMLFFFIAIILLSLNYALKTFKYNKELGSLSLGYIIFCLLYMIAQTPILFFSTMDSFFITLLCVIIPKYVYNNCLYKSSTIRSCDENTSD